jgi:uncharacterized membrane protein
MNIPPVTIARVLHVLAVVLWIGGVAMVTTVLLPAVRKMHSGDERINAFEALERRFAWQARITTLITGITGFYMLYELDAWERYLQPQYWWVYAMTIIWFLFSIILYVLEPLFLHKLYRKMTAKNPDATFRFVQCVHFVLLLLSLVTIAGAVAGSHGCFWLK